MRKVFAGMLAIILVFVHITSTAQNQSNKPYIPSILPASPDVAALMKFTDIPVSPYTGTANVDVPIYTIPLKGMNLPISLDYHTGGIKLKEESGWVGLGWALNPGGAISRTIMDEDDFGSGGYAYFTTAVPQYNADLTSYQPYPANGAPILGPYTYDFYCTYLVGTTAGNEDFTNAFQLGTKKYDMEPDIFNYNIPGHSGKFILSRTGVPILQKQENIRIRFPASGQSFTITDDQGNNYYFNAHDQTQGFGAATPITTWYMTKLVTQQGDSIVFTYTAGGGGITYSPISQYYNAYCFSTDAGPQNAGGVPTTYEGQTLQSIDFPSGRLVFKSAGQRSDLVGSQKLDSVLLYSKSADGTLTYLRQFNFSYSYFNATTPTPTDSFQLYRLRLDSVKELSGNTAQPPYSFVYSKITDGFRPLKYSFDIDHWGYYNKGNNSQLIPSVNILYAPPGISNTSLFTYTGANRLPDPIYMQAFSLQQVNYPTGGKTVFNYEANDCDYQRSQTGPTDFPFVALTTVDSIFHVVKHGTTNGTIDLSHIYPIIPTGVQGQNLTIKVTFRYQNNGATNYNNVNNVLTFDCTGPGVNVHSDITAATCDPNSPVCTVAIPLAIPAGTTYNWSAYIDNSVDTIHVYSETMVDFHFQETVATYNLLNNNSAITTASGIRIQSMTNYSDATTVASKKVYSYGYLADKLGTGTPQKYSYGRLMAIPSYMRYVPTRTSTSANCIQLSLFSSSYTPLSSVIQGNIVGYDQVTETSIDPSTGADIGKTVYTYFNSGDSAVSYGGFRFPGALSVGNSLNGSLLSKITYSRGADNNYYKLAETDNFYHTTNRSIYFSPKYSFLYATAPNESLDPRLCTLNTTVPVETLACFYPSIKSERVLLDSTVDFYYQQNGSPNAVVKRAVFYYDNPVHYQLTRSRTVDSKGNTLVAFSKYPQDYLPSGNTLTGNAILDTMINRNMVSATLEKTDSLYFPGTSSGSVAGSQLNTFRLLAGNGNTVVPDRVYKLDIPLPVTSFQPYTVSGNTTSQDSRYSQKIRLDKYDRYSNLTQYTPVDPIPVSFIWDYSGRYPIAKATNADTASIAYTSFEADGTGNWTVPSPVRDTTTAVTGRKSYNLSNGPISIGVPPGNYYITFWGKGLPANEFFSAPSSYPPSPYPQMLNAVTGLTKNGWTMYGQGLTTGRMGTSISIGGSGLIDELRLYPIDAQMTTYTYDPLVGMTSQIDVGNRVTYYEYDGFQRLRRIRDQDRNILKSFEYQYQAPAGCGSGCYILPMQTFAGSNTIGYPVGVFSINAKLLGNATGPDDYIAKWNSDTGDARIGTLAKGGDPVHFNLTLNAGQTPPAGVTGCRYYQYDLSWTNLDGVTFQNGDYVDFGDGTGFRIPSTPSDTPKVAPPNTVRYGFFDQWDQIWWFIHSYPDSSLKTVTFYHSDDWRTAFIDNGHIPATSLTKLSNLRGNLPQQTSSLGGSCYHQASALSVAAVSNWNSISGVAAFFPHCGDGVNACEHLSYTQDFMKNNRGLTAINTTQGAYYAAGYRDSTFKLTRLKTDWNTYFTELQDLEISDEHWNREDLSALTKLNTFMVLAGNRNHSNDPTNNPTIQIPYQVTDNILNQIAAGAGQNVSNGTVRVWSAGGGRSQASNAGVNLLIGKGWRIYIDGVLQTIQ